MRVSGFDRLPLCSNTEKLMTIHLEVVPMLSLVAGVAILLVPRLLNFIVAIYLIVIGVIGVFHL
jgi:hypothetical protein